MRSRAITHIPTRWALLGLCLLLAISAALVFGRRHRRSSRDSELRRALANRQWQASLELAQEWLRREPDSVVAAWLVWRTAHRLPDDHASWAGRDLVYSVYSGPPPDRRPLRLWAQTLVAGRPRNPVAWQLLADTYTLEPEPSPLQALAAGEEAVRLAPDDPYSYLARAWAAYVAGRVPQAIRDVQTALRLDTHCAAAYGDLAVLYGVQRKRDRQFWALREALRVDPRYSTAHVFLGSIYARAGDSARAAAELEQAVASGAECSSIHGELARNYARLKRPAAALEEANTAIELLPHAGMPYCVRAEVYAAQGQRAAALDDVERAVTLQPRYTHLQYRAFRLLRELGRSAEARAAGRAFLSLASADDPRRREVAEVVCQ